MIEAIIISYLEKLLSVPIYAEIPSNPPKEYVIVQKLGGGMTNLVSAATIGFESYSNSMLNAAKLDGEVQNAMFNIVTLDDISGVSIGGESRNIDEANKRYCYESIFNIYYYK